MARPLIGVSTYLDEAQWGRWRMRAVLLPAGYARLVRDSGGIAVLLPPGDPPAAADAVARLDGIVVAGGPDVEPVRYGERPHPRTEPPARERDAWELALIAAALAAGTPLLGICRGMQLLNVALGGTLVQHLPDEVGHDGHTGSPGAFGSHAVTAVEGTRLASVVPGRSEVPTFHHQALGRLGRGLRISAYADDGTVEAVEAAGSDDAGGAGNGPPGGTGTTAGPGGTHRTGGTQGARDGTGGAGRTRGTNGAASGDRTQPPEGGPRAPFVLGVQWHPEMGDDLRVMKALVGAAAAAEE